MDSLRIDDGVKRIAINDDPGRVIAFNPTDVVFAEKFYALIGEFEIKLKEYQRMSDALESDKATDSNDLPVNMTARISLLREVCEYIRGRIDYLFGVGTSQIAFGDVMAMEVFEQFFAGITPYFQRARSAKVEQYSSKTYVKKGAK